MSHDSGLPPSLDLSESLEEQAESTSSLHPFRITKKRVFRGFLILVGITIFYVAVSSKQIIEEVNRPLGPTLPSFSSEPSAIADLPEIVPSDTPLPPNIPTPTATEPPVTLCGGPPEMTILAIGIDSRTPGYQNGLADVIRVLRVDFVTPAIHVLTIPRDLWVTIPGLEPYGDRLVDYFGIPLDVEGEEMDFPANSARINVAYFYGTLYDLPGSGPGTLALSLYDSFGISIDHYVVVDMQILPMIIDKVGGIDIEVTLPTEEFAAGYQHMSGEDALVYARTRKTDNDWYRTSRQNEVMLALRERMLSPSILADMPRLVDIFIDDVLTDLSKAEISILTCLMTKVDREDITSYTIGPEMVTITYTTNGSFILLPTQSEIDPLINIFLDN